MPLGNDRGKPPNIVCRRDIGRHQVMLGALARGQNRKVDRTDIDRDNRRALAGQLTGHGASDP